jgi:hypothetical protein
MATCHAAEQLHVAIAARLNAASVMHQTVLLNVHQVTRWYQQMVALKLRARCPWCCTMWLHSLTEQHGA